MSQSVRGRPVRTPCRLAVSLWGLAASSGCLGAFDTHAGTPFVVAATYAPFARETGKGDLDPGTGAEVVIINTEVLDRTRGLFTPNSIGIALTHSRDTPSGEFAAVAHAGVGYSGAWMLRSRGLLAAYTHLATGFVASGYDAEGRGWGLGVKVGGHVTIRLTARTHLCASASAEMWFSGDATVVAGIGIARKH